MTSPVLPRSILSVALAKANAGAEVVIDYGGASLISGKSGVRFTVPTHYDVAVLAERSQYGEGHRAAWIGTQRPFTKDVLLSVLQAIKTELYDPSLGRDFELDESSFMPCRDAVAEVVAVFLETEDSLMVHGGVLRTQNGSIRWSSARLWRQDAEDILKQISAPANVTHTFTPSLSIRDYDKCAFEDPSLNMPVSYNPDSALPLEGTKSHLLVTVRDQGLAIEFREGDED